MKRSVINNFQEEVYMRIKLFITIILFTLSIHLYAGRANDIEFAIQHLITAIEIEVSEIIVANSLQLSVLDHNQKSYYSSQYFKLNFIKDAILVSSKFPNEVEVVLFPVIEEFVDYTPFLDSSELNIKLTILNRDRFISKKYKDKVDVKIKIICSDSETKSLLINSITAESLYENFHKLNKAEEMMRSSIMKITLQ